MIRARLKGQQRMYYASRCKPNLSPGDRQTDTIADAKTGQFSRTHFFGDAIVNLIRHKQHLEYLLFPHREQTVRVDPWHHEGFQKGDVSSKKVLSASPAIERDSDSPIGSISIAYEFRKREYCYEESSFRPSSAQNGPQTKLLLAKTKQGTTPRLSGTNHGDSPARPLRGVLMIDAWPRRMAAFQTVRSIDGNR